MHTFPCSAKELLDIIATIYGRHKWLNPDAMVAIHKVFEDVVLKRIYSGEPLDMVICALDPQNRWKNVARIVLLGKANKIPENDWLVALCAQAEAVFCQPK